MVEQGESSHRIESMVVYKVLVKRVTVRSDNMTRLQGNVHARSPDVEWMDVQCEKGCLRHRFYLSGLLWKRAK